MAKKYVDGFVLVIPKKNVGAYRKMATEAGQVWKRFGALDYKECMGQELAPDTSGMQMLGFAALTKLKKTETVWFSYILYKSRAHRDSVNKKVMAYFDKKYGKGDMKMPFDMRRFSYGGFTVEVDF